MGLQKKELAMGLPVLLPLEEARCAATETAIRELTDTNEESV